MTQLHYSGQDHNYNNYSFKMVLCKKQLTRRSLVMRKLYLKLMMYSNKFFCLRVCGKNSKMAYLIKINVATIIWIMVNMNNYALHASISIYRVKLLVCSSYVNVLEDMLIKNIKLLVWKTTTYFSSLGLLSLCLLFASIEKLKVNKIENIGTMKIKERVA